MKICQITTVHPKNDNRIFYKECITLKNFGHEVTLIVAGETDQEIDGIKILGLNKYTSRLKRFFKTSILEVLRTVKRVNADVYHFHDPELIFMGLILKAKGKKVIYDIHENNSAAIMSKPYIQSRIIKIVISACFNLFEKTAVRYFDAVITARPDITKKFTHKKIITLRNFPILSGIKTDDVNDEVKEKKSVIYVGGMSKIRGIETLIDAFNEMPEFELWLLGIVRGELLRKKIGESKENVKYLGIVEPYEVFHYIQKADVGIITFLPVPNHVSTLATKPFEYMACGKPMIMSNFDYWKDTFGDSSLYVNPNNKKEIIKATRLLMNDDEIFDRMSKKNNRLSKEEYNWGSESKKLIDLYNSF
jgi:glycosyltransferase involved in cell wall biosynthesis